MTISFIVPVYNTKEELINRCIKSVTDQFSKESLDIVIVDDGSKQEIANACDLIAKKYPCIQVIHKENKGVSSARNIGIQKAKGEYIAFLDSDDTIPNDFNEKFTKYTNLDVDIFFCNTNIIYPKKVLSNSSQKDLILVKDNNDLLYSIITYKGKYSNIICIDGTMGKIYKKEFLINNKLSWNTKLRRHEDSYFIVECILKSPTVAILPIASYNYVFNINSICQRFDPSVKKDTKMAVEAFSSLLRDQSSAIIDALNYKIVRMIIDDDFTRYYASNDNHQKLNELAKDFKNYIRNNPEYLFAFKNIKERDLLSRLLKFAVKSKQEKLLFYLYRIGKKTAMKIATH